MKKRISAYLDYLAALPCDGPDEELAKKILVQIQLAQHERLIHLLVTLFFGLFEVIAFAIFGVLGNLGAGCFAMALLVLLVPYIFHYYFLENSVQAMYQYYDKFAGETFLEDAKKNRGAFERAQKEAKKKKK